jgi:hypothetical protein
MLMIVLIGLTGAAVPVRGPALDGPETYCITTGYCTSRPAESGRPSGPMFLVVGLIGAGLAGLLRE